MTLLVLHLLAISHGVAVGLAWFLLFHVAGLALLPRRWHGDLARGGVAASLGAALYVLVCWFGVGANVRLTPLALAFAATTLAAAYNFRTSSGGR